MYLNFNGDIVPASQNNVHHTNRAFRYGDGIFESMAMFDGKVKLLALHCRRMAMGAQLLELNLPVQLQEDHIAFELEKLRKANNITNARIRIVLFRDSGGFYAPVSNEAGFVMELYPIENNHYELNKKGLRIALYKEILKPINILSNIKTCNALLYVKAGLFKNKSGYDECIILNQNNNLCEGISTNLFWVKDKIVYTPSASSGCIMGVMRNYLLEFFKENKIAYEEGEYNFSVIANADEVFLSGATRGLQWVKEIDTGEIKFTYTNAMTKIIFAML
jgi:branched-subunit amino acid aminotransferase/4-amino-4-deoxychorismate lyase